MPVRKTAIARGERGYAMVALLVLMAVMAVAMTVALPAWSTLARREKEAELVFRGEQYARAIMLFQRKYAGAFPPTVDVLVDERFLRKKFKDPITNDDFKTIGVGEAVSTAQTANPLSPSATGGAAAGQVTGAPRGGNTPQTGGRATFPPGGTGGAQGAQTGGRSTFTLGGTTAGGRGGGIGVAGASAGIMGVTSKSTDESIREYKGADHYNQWLFIATQASVQAGGRGGRSPGEGVRGGQPPTSGRQGGPGRGTPFGSTPFGRGQQPPPPPPAPPGRGRF
jgi:type II secretory pathway pseudopilin PulG